MNMVTPKLPAGSRVLFNALYKTSDSRSLTDDLFAAILPDGVHVSVGWFPELDPSGEYEICFYRGDYEHQLIDPIATRNLEEVVRIIEERSPGFVQTPRFVSESGSKSTCLSPPELSTPWSSSAFGMLLAPAPVHI
jgi:hypothetical protein